MRCEGKVAYDTGEQAFLMIARLRKRGMKQQGYLCPRCGKYHTGRAKPGDRDGINIARFNTRTARAIKRMLKRRLEELRLRDLEEENVA